eukprot:TRINITY_DN20865_c0_g1_i1.p1 TRINITY_DN20865_c0_g1~~TRINITY_DN20865_c0_g1_i1.p1  ORF type:complete len:373 (+),score=68.63 TRINITY_DN20865_c0_g1_i1:94-1119(+)
MVNECARIAMRHKVGSVGSLLGQRQTPHKRDCKRDNIRVVRSMSRDVQRRRKESENAPPSDFKLKQFGNVPSRLHQTPKRNLLSSPSPSATPTPGKARSASSPALSPAKLSAPKEGQSPWARAPLRPCNEMPRPSSAAGKEGGSNGSSSAKRGQRKGREEAPAGARLIFSPPPRCSGPCPPQTGETGEPESNAFGQPRRLFCEEVERNRSTKERPASSHGAAENKDPGWWPRPGGSAVPAVRTKSTGAPARRLQAPFAESEACDSEATVPAGYRLLPEEERLTTLEELRKKLHELNDRYMRLPLKIETEGARQQQQTLREKIAQTERAEMLFSRPTVLVEL